uniref:Uncharacterized protein n=1 Tax=Ananas comosus var. bracteatus TaxID=296719 RepID=A0A6V7PS34_ANACO|nr:unnamed protein product [Ananas comosus var. bracteatus]
MPHVKKPSKSAHKKDKSGWGWDYVQNIPTIDDPSDWDAIIAENPAYVKCRDKPFPAYKDIAFLTAKTTATGRYDFSSGMPATPSIDSSSLSSPGEDESMIGESVFIQSRTYALRSRVI